MRPILKWAGGKARLVGEICSAFGESCGGTYFEPFVGSGAVFLGRRVAGEVKDAVLADVNPKLMEVHRVVRDDVEGLLKAIAELPQEDWRERYYDVRDAYNEGPWEGTEHAARFVWLNRAGFNGLYRENRKGKFNVPCGSYKRLSIPTDEHFRAVSALYQGVEMVVSDFEPLMERAGKGDQVYCDPPYVPLSATASFTAYSKEPFGPAEQERLAQLAEQVAHSGGRVVLSNHDLPLVRHDLYPESRGFEHCSSLDVTRAISRSGASRKRVGEVIAAIGPLGAAA